MDVARPHRAVIAGLDGDVLLALAQTTRPMTGRMIARTLGQASHDGVRKSLDRLTRQGIVRREQTDQAFLHHLNREHVAAEAVVALVDLRNKLWRRLREWVKSWELQPIHASVFGSAARGDGDETSDIDVLLVRPRNVGDDDELWRRQVAQLAEAVLRWTGNHLGVIELDERSLGDLRTEPRQVLDDLRQDGIDLVGIPIRTLFSTSDTPTSRTR